MYRKSDRVNTIRELLDGYHNDKGKDNYKIRDTKEIISRDNYRGWIGLNLGDLIVTPVRKMRSKYPKKTAENEFYKLIGNTVYGVLCSKYFSVSNVVTANNITSGVRTGVWCLEKGLNSHNSITDGGLSNALTVAFGNGKKLTDKNIIQTHRINKREHSKSVRYGIIGGYDAIEWTGIKSQFCSLKDRKTHDKLLAEGKTPAEIDKVIVSTEQLLSFSKNGITEQLNNNSARALMDNLIFNHLAEQFPKLDIFHADFSDDDGNPRKLRSCT